MDNTLQFRNDELLVPGLKRVITFQLVQAKEICSGKEDIEIKAHEIRKHLKKTRSLLRIARYNSSAKYNYKNLNRLCRDTGRLLSGIRDAYVYPETLEYLKKIYKRKLPNETYQALSKKLIAYRENLTGDINITGKLLQKTDQNLDKILEMIVSLRLEPAATSDVFKGLQKTYTRGYKSLQATFTSQNTDMSGELFHEWRKQVKYLMYQLEFLYPIWPPMMKVHVKTLDSISDILGIEHDINELIDFICQEENDIKIHGDGILFFLAALKRESCQYNAKIQGKKYFSMKPGVFSRMLENWHQVFLENRKQKQGHQKS